MHFLAATSLLLTAIGSLTVAAPTNDRETTVVPPPRYYLQSKVVGEHRDCGDNKNDLWLYSHHTGAGLGDAAFSPNKSSAMEGYLNETRQVFTYAGNQIGPWPLAISWGPYQSFSLATISIAGRNVAVEGFFFNQTGLQFNSSYGGWLACDWWHGAPQLFNLNGYFYGSLPNSCSRINLLPVAVDTAPAY